MLTLEHELPEFSTLFPVFTHRFSTPSVLLNAISKVCLITTLLALAFTPVTYIKLRHVSRGRISQRNDLCKRGKCL
jgi:hypothetical protein